MTISSSTRKAGPFTGNGTTATYPFTFKVFQASDLLVVRTSLAGVETTLTLTTDYTVSLNADQNSSPGGSVTLVAGNLATGLLLTMTSQVPYTQTTDLTNQGGFYPQVITNSLDKLTIQTQQLQEQVDRSAKLPLSSSADPDSLVADITLLADNIADINTVVNNIGDVNDVADNMADVNIVADNLVDVTNFADVYQGAKASDPTLRNDGSALQAGDLYFNTTNSEMRVYGGTLWKSGFAGTLSVQRFSGNGSTTAFTLTSAPAGENNTQVYISGVYQQKDTYSVSGTTLTFSSAPTIGTDNIEVVTISTLALGQSDSALSIFVQSGTGAVSRTVQSKLRESVSVKDFGAVGDGNRQGGGTDNSAVLQNALDYLNSVGGGTLRVPAGVYRLNTALTAYSNITIEMDGAALFDITNISSGTGAILVTGTANSEVNLGVAATRGDNTLTTATAHNLAVGDWVLVHGVIDCLSTDANDISGANWRLGSSTAGGSKVYFGEFVEVKEVTSSTGLTLGQRLLFPGYGLAAVGSGARSCSTVRKINWAENFWIVGGGVVSYSATQVANQGRGFLRLTYCRNSGVRNSSGDFTLQAGAFARYDNCLNCAVDNVTVTHSANLDVDAFAHSDYNSWKVVSSTNTRLRVFDIHGSQGADETYVNGGWPCINTDISGGSYKNLHAAVTSHGGSYGICYHDFFAIDCRQSVFNRARFFTIDGINVKTSNTSSVGSVQLNSWGACDGSVTNCHFDGSVYAIRAEFENVSAMGPFKRNLNISNNYFSRNTRAVMLFPSPTGTVTFNATTDIATISGNVFENGQSIVFSGGTLPAELNTSTTYYVVERSGNTFKVAASVGGAAINLSTAGSGTITAIATSSELSGITVANNTIVDATDYGIYIGNYVSGVVVKNNYFSRLGASAVAVYKDNNSVRPVIQGNVFDNIGSGTGITLLALNASGAVTFTGYPSSNPEARLLNNVFLGTTGTRYTLPATPRSQSNRLTGWDGEVVVTGNASSTVTAMFDNAGISYVCNIGGDSSNVRYSMGAAATPLDSFINYNNSTKLFSVATNGTTKLNLDTNGHLYPAGDGTQNLGGGAAANRWGTVYATTGTINTSDAREKQQVRELLDAEKRVAVKLKSLIRAFKYNDAVLAKGDGARIHVGVIAQDVKDAFESEGLNAYKYALFCYDEWDNVPDILNEDGEIETHGKSAGNRFGVRYEELLAFVIAAL